MKLSHYLLASWAMLSCLTACKNNLERVDPSQPGTQPSGQTDGVTEVGQPNGTAISKLIGPEGGIIATEDGNVQLVLPAGALAKTTNITIQPITSFTPNGIGQAYRFSPDGTTFSKPATLTFQYTNSIVSVNAPDVFGVAYQGADKIWYSVPGVKTDVTKQTIAVPMNHFSDWSAVERGQLGGWSTAEKDQLEDFGIFGDTFYDVVGYGESQEYWVAEIALSDDNKSEKPLIQKPVYNENWSLLGQGTGKLVANGSRATYTAPTFITPKSNPVTISVEVYFENSKTKLILNRQIIVGLGYVTFTFKGEDYIFTDVQLDSDGIKAYQRAGTDNYIFVYVYGMKAGRFSFGSTQSGTSQIQLTTPQADGFDSFPGACYDVPIVTKGYVNVVDYDPNKLVMGYFSGGLLEQKVNHCGGSITGNPISDYFVLKNRG